MDNNVKQCYKKPQVEVVEIELKSSILSVSGDPSITNPDMGWGVSNKRDAWDDF